MRVILLAAGRGERMRPLTDSCPKPLLRAGGRALIEWHLLALARAGFVDVVINHAWLGERIEAELGDGSRWGLRIQYSPEGEALETAGGIAHALPLLGPEPFAAIAADIHCDFDFGRLPAIAQRMQREGLLAWCVLVPNPAHHPGGDFALRGGRLHNDGEPRLTFSGIGVYDPHLFDHTGAAARAALAPLLRSAADAGLAGGECHDGRWHDIGTAPRLASLDAQLRLQQANAD